MSQHLIPRIVQLRVSMRLIRRHTNGPVLQFCGFVVAYRLLTAFVSIGHVLDHVAAVAFVLITTLVFTRARAMMASDPSVSVDLVHQTLSEADHLAEPSKPVPTLPPTISASLFHNTVLEFNPCLNPDCTLVSLDGLEFPSRKDLLIVVSDTFRDMFLTSCSPSTHDGKVERTRIELVETSHVLSLLLSIAHTPPPAFPPRPRTKFQMGKAEPDTKREVVEKPPPEGLLPFEHLRELLDPLAQKYAFTDELLAKLRTHLAEHTLRYPLDAYVLASGLAAAELPEMKEIASNASQYLLSPTLTSLPISAARKFPSAESYALLLRLQLFRIERFQAILRDPKNGVFPYDYQICPTHGALTRKLWEGRKKTLEGEMDAGTDLALQMGNTVLPAVRHCEVCYNGANAAVEMIRYVTYRVPRRIEDLPLEEEIGNK